jgi:signal transduction histidine kinase
MVDNGEGPRVAAAWPAPARLPGEAPDHQVEVAHRGEHLGTLALWSHEGEALNATERRLLSDLAHQAGLVFHNASLTAELQRRLEELQASRLRLVAAQDAERRRLERDLHDGAQHDLVALRMKLGQAEAVAARSCSELAALIAELRQDTGASLETIRRLGRGLYPPLLESQGLAAALTAHSRRLPVPVEVRAADDRFARDLETAVYFCCVEALQNTAKHAAASRAWVTIDSGERELCFEVGDDGRGIDAAKRVNGSGLQNIRDRVEALGGTLSVASGPAGTVLRGTMRIG